MFLPISTLTAPQEGIQVTVIEGLFMYGIATACL